jgi:hypothetical protein
MHKSKLRIKDFSSSRLIRAMCALRFGALALKPALAPSTDHFR